MSVERPGDAAPLSLSVASEEEEKDEPDELDVTVDNVQMISPRSNLKSSASKRRQLGVTFSEQQPQIETFEIDEGHNFRRTPTAAKLKAMAGRWSNPFALNTSRKRLRVDEMEDADETKASEPAPPEEATPRIALDPSTLTDQELDAKFLEVAIEAWAKLASSSQLFKVEHMVPDLKGSGLFDVVKAKHGTVRKWFMLHPETFGLSNDNFISRAGHNEEFLAKVKDTLEAAPKQTMKLHQLATDLKSQVSENGFRKCMKGYDTLLNFLAAHSNQFMLSKDRMFVTIRRDPS